MRRSGRFSKSDAAGFAAAAAAAEVTASSSRMIPSQAKRHTLRFVAKLILLHTIVVASLLSLETVNAGMVNVCSDVKDCAPCTTSYVNIFAFREACRWCYSTSACGGPISCPTGVATAQRDPFKCPTKASMAKGRRYTDKLGRSLYALTLAAKNTKEPQECLKNSRPDVKVIKSYEVECDASHNSCAGYLAVSEEAKALYVIYRGSSVDRQLFQEFIHGIAAQFGAWEKFVNGSGVMTYFHNAFQKLFINGGMKAQLLKMKELYEGYRVWIAGHSLGGSLASMTALYIVNQTLFPSDRVKLVTFGEPRTGNLNYAKAIEANLGFRYRVVNGNDMVTNVPASVDPDNLFLTVASSESYAVHYKKGMESREAEYEVCEYPEDHHCRPLALTVDVNDHMNYFGVKFDDYLKAGCPREMIL